MTYIAPRECHCYPPCQLPLASCQFISNVETEKVKLAEAKERIGKGMGQNRMGIDLTKPN